MTIPSSCGTYILIVDLPVPITIEIGKLGSISFSQGTHAYVGSALGPGGLAARLRRYRVGPRRLHWHIDYLLERAVVAGWVYRADDKRRECSWARWAASMAQGWVPCFGSSDCRCQSDLLFIGSAERAEEFMGSAGCELKAFAANGSR